MVGRWKSIDYALMARIMRAVNYTVHVSELHGIWGKKNPYHGGGGGGGCNFKGGGGGGGKGGRGEEGKQRWVYKIMGGEKNE